MLLTGLFWKFLELHARAGDSLMRGDFGKLKASAAVSEGKQKKTSP